MKQLINVRLTESEIYTLQNLLAITRNDFRSNIIDLKNLFNNQVDLIKNKK